MRFYPAGPAATERLPSFFSKSWKRENCSPELRLFLLFNFIVAVLLSFRAKYYSFVFTRLKKSQIHSSLKSSAFHRFDVDPFSTNHPVKELKFGLHHTQPQFGKVPRFIATNRKMRKLKSHLRNESDSNFLTFPTSLFIQRQCLIVQPFV